MNRRSHRGTRIRTTIGWALLALLGLGTSPSPLRAATIRSHRLIPATPANLGPRWSRFLAGGPTWWARSAAPSFPSYLVLPSVNGQLLQTPFLQYLEWRRSFHPARFDFFHPNVARQLTAQINATAIPTVNPSPTTIVAPRVVPPIVNPQPQTVVPEPDTLWIGLTLVAGALGWRWRLRMVESRQALDSCDATHDS